MMRTATPHMLNHYAEEASTRKKGRFSANLFPVALIVIGAIGLFLMLSAGGRAF